MFYAKSLNMSFSVVSSFLLYCVIGCLQSVYKLLERSCKRCNVNDVEY